MRRIKGNTVIIVYVALVVAMLATVAVGQIYHPAQATAGGARPADICAPPTWCTVTTSNQSGSNTLYGTSALSNKDAWSVGIYNNSYTGGNLLTQHWDGNTWTQVNAASVPTTAGFLATSATASNDVWAVGWDNYNGLVQLTLAQHWNGTSWSTVTTPNGDANAGNVLSGIASVSTNDVWAVGDYNRSGSHAGDGIDFTLIEQLADTGFGKPPCTPSNGTTQRSEDALGNDVYQVDFCDGAAASNIYQTLNINRYYGPLSVNMAITGTISSGAIGKTVAPTATLSVLANGINQGEVLTVTLRACLETRNNIGNLVQSGHEQTNSL